MNERIKEIWEESTQCLWPRPGKFTAGERDFQLEKFAEMIVLETLRVVDATPSMSETAKKHFGVEK